MPIPLHQAEVIRAAKLIAAADGLLITAGAGMGVDSGLPDFRSGAGFWGAYPALGQAGLHFESIASPQAFEDRPRLAWGFYGHRLNLYRRTIPHDGFRILRDIGNFLPHGAFVFTSNVDGQFQRAGFRDTGICEVHGSIHHLQCMNGCAVDIWSADDFEPIVDETTCLLTSGVPICPHCGGLARPNVLMFGDWGWLPSRERRQDQAMKTWLEQAERPVVIEIGAGTAIPTARMLGQWTGAPMIRINLRDAQVSRIQDVGLAMGALDALTAISAGLSIGDGQK